MAKMKKTNKFGEAVKYLELSYAAGGHVNLYT